MPAEDQQVGGPRLARQGLGRVVDEGPPAGAPAFPLRGRAEPLVRGAQSGLHALLFRFQDLDATAGPKTGAVTGGGMTARLANPMRAASKRSARSAARRRRASAASFGSACTISAA